MMLEVNNALRGHERRHKTAKGTNITATGAMETKRFREKFGTESQRRSTYAESENRRQTFNREREGEQINRAEEMENTARRQEGKGKVEKQEKHPWEASLGAAGSEVRATYTMWEVCRSPGGPL